LLDAVAGQVATGLGQGDGRMAQVPAFLRRSSRRALGQAIPSHLDLGQGLVVSQLVGGRIENGKHLSSFNGRALLAV
jgi:hypothetical protein